MSDHPREPEVTPAQRWFRLAEQDLAAAGVLLRDGSTAQRIVGILAQQAAEKALSSGFSHSTWSHHESTTSAN